MIIMSKLHMDQRIRFLKDDIINGKRYRTMRKGANRNWYDDISELDYGVQYRFDIDDSAKRNVFYINDKPVVSMTYAETAMFYRFLKRCLYR